MESLLKSPMKLVLLTGMWAYPSSAILAGIWLGACRICSFYIWLFVWTVIGCCVFSACASQHKSCRLIQREIRTHLKSNHMFKMNKKTSSGIILVIFWSFCLHSMALQSNGSMQVLWHLWLLSPTCNMQGPKRIKRRLLLQPRIHGRWNNILLRWI